MWVFFFSRTFVCTFVCLKRTGALSETRMQYHHAHRVTEVVSQVKQSILYKVLRVVDKNECVAMEREEVPGVLSQQPGQLFPPAALS